MGHVRESKEQMEIRQCEESLAQMDLGRDERVKIVRRDLILLVRLHSITPSLFQRISSLAEGHHLNNPRSPWWVE